MSLRIIQFFEGRKLRFNLFGFMGVINMRKTFEIMGIPVDAVTMDTALLRLKEFINEDKLHMIFTPNAEIMMEAHTDPELSKILKEADMVIPDGAGVVLASKILGTPLPAKVPGFDLSKNSFSMDYGRKIRYFFYGAKPGVAIKAAQVISSTSSNAEIVGIRDGYDGGKDQEELIQAINESNADILLVALGAPRQEKWIYENKDKLRVRVAIGVGGTLDGLAGVVPPAPDFFRNNGLEWLYRLYKEPWRYKRMMNLPKYVLTVIGYRLKNQPKAN